MIASLMIEMAQTREERRAGRPPKLTVKGAWVEGDQAVGALVPAQMLAMIEEARMQILASIPFTPPEERKIAVVGPTTLKDIERKLVDA